MIINKFKINNHDTRTLEILYSSIDINNIENYLKRIETQERTKKIKISFIPNKYLYSLSHLLFATYITENRFVDKMNVSDSFNTELLLVLSDAKDQINKINKELYLIEGKNKNKEVFVLLVSEKGIKEKDIESIKKELNLTIISDEKIKFNKKEALDFYKVKEPDAEEKIIEKMALSIIDK
jgi:tRNA threonylcarbamoyladenosine modification (KEOPS) complex Cgi121 subunit